MEIPITNEDEMIPIRIQASLASDILVLIPARYWAYPRLAEAIALAIDSVLNECPPH